jgi:hypothetical protein
MPELWLPPKLYSGKEQVDFERRFVHAEAIKQDMRRKYSRLTRKPDTFEDMQRRAEDFWAEYEEVNRHYVPEDPVFSKVTTGLTVATTNDIWEIGAASAGQCRIIESFVAGEATASTVARITIARVNTQGTGTAPTTYTPEKFNTRSPAAASTVYGAVNAQVAWGTAQPALSANPLVAHVYNSLGGSDRWVAQPGEELYLVNAEFCTLRAAVAAGITSAYVVFEEL